MTTNESDEGNKSIKKSLEKNIVITYVGNFHDEDIELMAKMC